MLAAVVALFATAAPASAHTLTLDHAFRLADRLDLQYQESAKSPVEVSDIFEPRRVNRHRIDFSYFARHANGRECEARIVVQFRNSRFRSARAKFVSPRCDGP